MSNESFDFDELDTLTSQSTITAWSSHVAPKGRTRRAYGRRGSTGVLSASSSVFSSYKQPEEPIGFLSPTKEENEFGQFSPVSAPKIPEHGIRGRRFTRANSISAFSHTSSSMQSSKPSLRRCASVSTSSVSSSSFSSVRSNSLSSYFEDSISEMGGENVHPNANPMEAFASPKRSSVMNDSRGRKKVRSARNLANLDSPSIPPIPRLPLSQSLSNFAQEESGGWGFPPPSTTDESPFPSRPGYLTELDPESPALSSVGSTRKRGICESPFEDYDDLYSSGPFASARTISRSRLLSPPVEGSGCFDTEFSQHSACKSKKDDSMDMPSDDGDSGDEIDSSDDLSVEEKRMRRSPVPTFVPFHQRASKVSFPEPISAKRVISTKGRPQDIIESMTSYNDLKFLAKKLRTERDESQINLCVPLPSGWQSQRRADFMRWGTNHLGFKLCSGGAQMKYLQISKSKGISLLKLLEESMAECKKQGLGGKTPAIASSAKKRFFNFNATPIATLPKTPRELMFTSPHLDMPEVTSTLDDDLMSGMQALGVHDDARVQPDFSVQASIILEDDEENSPHDPRPSVENHSSARDLMSHMGMTPVPRRRPQRLSLGSVATAGTASKFAASPFPQTLLASAKKSHCKSYTVEFIETPMAKPLDMGWGSNPVEGRDWGKSEQCDACILDTLLQKMKQAQLEAGCQLDDEDGMDCPRPTALGLDLEAASDYRDTSSSPDSTSNHGSTQGGGYFIGGMTESSPSSVGVSERIDAVYESQSQFYENDTRALRRRQTSFAKHKRMSLFASAVNPVAMFNSRKSLFVRPPRPSAFPLRKSTLPRTLVSEHTFEPSVSFGIDTKEDLIEVHTGEWLEDDAILKRVLVYLSEPELLRSASLVCTRWADVATEAHAELMLLSVGCKGFLNSVVDDSESDDDSVDGEEATQGLLERPWDYLTSTFPWARFLAEGGFKSVYKVFNRNLRVEEAISVMDINMLKDAGEMNVVGAELAVSVMLSSLVRRGICPNFVVTRGAFSCAYKPPASIWGSEKNKCPKGDEYISPEAKKRPREPKWKGRYQYIRMELCDGGDAEEFLKTVENEMLSVEQSRQLLFQMAFALHAAAIRCSLKHYDVKLLNYFLQHIKSESEGDVVLRYGLGDHIFSLRSSRGSAIMAKLADYGTANVDLSSNGQHVTIAQFTTLENTPVDFMILGDKAHQGHGHDNFGLGLCMLHLFTGHAPYEEIMDDISCPKNLKERLRDLWECEDEADYSVIRSVILSDVDKDEEGHIIEGEPNEVLYDTFYRFMVLFGLPDLPQRMSSTKVWAAVKECLDGDSRARVARGKKRQMNDVSRYMRDCRKYSITHGTNKYIRRARERLMEMDGGLDLLLALVSFDPDTRYTAMDVMNSPFMESLREKEGGLEQYSESDDVRTFTSFSTQY